MVRRAGFALVGLGLLLIAWTVITVVFGDPITSMYTRHEQHVLAHQLHASDRHWSTRRGSLRARALSFARSLHDGDPIGRITVPRLRINMVVVQGTTESDLRKGPGHYDAGSGANTSLPGLGGVIAIAGHRTTYLHPFRHIDDLRVGDRLGLAMPYGRFVYQVVGHRVVTPSDWSILEPTSYEEVVLSACDPPYSASHRYVVFARLVKSPVRSAAVGTSPGA
jgi:sortase A